MVMWTIVAVLLVLLAGLHFAGARALAAWGVRPSKGVISLRALNVVAVIGVVVFALWKSVS